MRKLFKKFSTAIAIVAMSFGVATAVNAQSEVVGAKAAEISTISVLASDFTTTDGVQTHDYDGITIGGKLKQFNTSNLWFTSGSGYIYNNISLNKIVKITLTYNVGGSASAVQRFNLGSTAMSSYMSTGGTTRNVATGGTSYDYLPSGDFGFFNISVSSKNLQLSGFVIEYELSTETFGTLDHIAVSTATAKTSFLVGETFDSTGLVVTAFDELGVTKPATAFTTDLDAYVFQTSDLGTNTVTVSYTDSLTVTTTYTVEVITVQTFSKITSVSELYFGAEYILVSEGATTPQVMTTTMGTFAGTTNVTVTSGSVIDQPNYQKVQVVFSPEVGSYGLKLVNGDSKDKYLALTSDANNLNTATSFDTNKSASWFITFEDGNATINSERFSTRTIKYNNGSPRFSTYTSGQLAVQLFLNTETVNHTGIASMFATEVNTGKGYMAEGKCEATLTFLQSIYGRLSLDAKTIVDTSSETTYVNARERMALLQSWVTANPGARQTVVSTGRNNMMAVIAIGAIGLTSILGYYFINKKKVWDKN